MNTQSSHTGNALGDFPFCFSCEMLVWRFSKAHQQQNKASTNGHFSVAMHYKSRERCGDV